MLYGLGWDTIERESDYLGNCYSLAVQVNRARFVKFESGPSEKARFVWRNISWIFTEKFTWYRFSLLVRCRIGSCVDEGYGIIFIATWIGVILEGYDIGVAHGSVTIHLSEEFHVLVQCMTRRDEAFNFCDTRFQRPSGVRGRNEEGADAS